MGEIVKIDPFQQLTLKAYNFSIDCRIQKLKLVLNSSLICLSKYVFISAICFRSKMAEKAWTVGDFVVFHTALTSS